MVSESRRPAPIDLGRWPGLGPTPRPRVHEPGGGTRGPSRCGGRGRRCRCVSAAWERRSCLVGATVRGRSVGDVDCIVVGMGRLLQLGLRWDGVGSRSCGSSSPSEVQSYWWCRDRPSWLGSVIAAAGVGVTRRGPAGLRVIGVGSARWNSSSPSEVGCCERSGG